MMSHARRGLSELDPELHGQILAIARRQHSRSLKVCLVPYLDTACHIPLQWLVKKKARKMMHSKIFKRQELPCVQKYQIVFSSPGCLTCRRDCYLKSTTADIS